MSDTDTQYARLRLQEVAEGRSGMTAGGIEYCRGILAAEGLPPPPTGYTRDHLGRLVPAADKGEGPDPDERGTGPLDRQRGESAEASETAEEEALLGLLTDGTEMKTSACKASGKDPIAFLRTAGATLTKTGGRILEGLLAIAASDPVHRARSMGISIEAVTACAKANGLDPTAALAAEVEFQEELVALRTGEGLPPRAGTPPAIPIPERLYAIGADGDPVRAEADLRDLVERENAATGRRV